jgi:hypothetical protein
MSYRAENPDPVPLLFQTGYLAIRGYDERRRRYAFGVPNGEVSEGLLTGLLTEYAPAGAVGGGCDIYALDDCIESGDTDGMRDILAALFASIPYTTAKGGQDPFEYYFQAVIYVTFLLSKWVEVETHVATGRVDVVVECESHVYVTELKRDGNAAEALAQIEERAYGLRFAADTRMLHRIGCSFDSATRLLSDWVAV